MPIKYIGSNYPSDNSAIPQVNGKVTTASTGSGVVRNIYVSTISVAPSGGNDGDVWLQY